MEQWYQISAKKDSAKILIYEQIGQGWDDSGIGAKKFVEDLHALDVSNIDLHINSPGGNVFEGNAIYNALKAHKAKINVKIDGVAASIASIVAMSGDEIEMPENAMIMIHDPSGFVVGTAKDMQKMADAMDRMKIGLVAAYHNKTGVEKDKISVMMEDETWMTAQEAVAMGFADKMLEPVNAQANLEALAQYQYKNVPKQFLTAGESGKKTEKEKIMTLNELKVESPDLYNAVFEEGKKEGHAAGLVEGKAVGLEKGKTETQDQAKVDGATAERERIQGVEAQLIPGHETLIQDMKFDGKTTGEQAAVKILAAEKTLREGVLDKLDKDAPDPVATVLVPDVEAAIDPTDENLPIEDKAKAAWDKDPDLRAEFSNKFDAYLAYAKADAKGKAKILGK